MGGRHADDDGCLTAIVTSIFLGSAFGVWKVVWILFFGKLERLFCFFESMFLGEMETRVVIL